MTAVDAAMGPAQVQAEMSLSVVTSWRTSLAPAVSGGWPAAELPG